MKNKRYCELSKLKVLFAKESLACINLLNLKGPVLSKILQIVSEKCDVSRGMKKKVDRIQTRTQKLYTYLKSIWG